MKFYEVTLHASCTVLVEADDEKAAMRFAIDESSSGDYEFCEGGPAREVPEKEIASARRHADLIIEDES